MNESEEKKSTELGNNNSLTDSAESPAPSMTLPRSETPSEGRCFIAPRPGCEWNPLLRLPPNRPCPCLSGKKFKKCCRDKLQRAVPSDLAKQYRAQMDMPNLVFLNDENREIVKAMADPAIYDYKERELDEKLGKVAE